MMLFTMFIVFILTMSSCGRSYGEMDAVAPVVSNNEEQSTNYAPTSVESTISVKVADINSESDIILSITNNTAYPFILLDEISLGARTLSDDWDWHKIYTAYYALYISPGGIDTLQIQDVPFGRFIVQHVWRVPLHATEGEFPAQRVVFDAPIQFGVYRLTMNAAVGIDEYNITQLFEIDVQFQVTDPEIPLYSTGIFMFPISGSRSISFGIINLYDYGLIFFDRLFRLQYYDYGMWQDVPPLNERAYFNNEALSLYPRQSGYIWMNACELYNELEAGIYRAIKVFYHDVGYGNLVRHEIYASFTVCLPPWTTRREVVRFLENGIVATPIFDSNDSPAAQWHHMHIQMWISPETRVLNSDGMDIHYTDIPLGAIVDITYGEWLLGWGNISEVHEIQILD